LDTRIGLRLAGIEGAEVHGADELKNQLNLVMADKDIGILLIVENLAKLFPDLIMELKINRTLPLVVEIPDRHGSGRSAEFITNYIREAIGVKM
jgi:V/A-type H+-transporting ATPase subunit F